MMRSDRELPGAAVSAAAGSWTSTPEPDSVAQSGA
ncbi:MAG: hypothetical protein JWL71_4636 [Acidobacteria bacterium]|nr:hypothetical protein [Acidobacteriota bacterium]